MLFRRRAARGSLALPLESYIARRVALRVSIVTAAPAIPNPNFVAADAFPLAVAVSQDNLEMVRLLLENGADVNLRIANGATSVLQIAKSESVRQLLQSRGAVSGGQQR